MVLEALEAHAPVLDEARWGGACLRAVGQAEPLEVWQARQAGALQAVDAASRIHLLHLVDLMVDLYATTTDDR